MQDKLTFTCTTCQREYNFGYDEVDETVRSGHLLYVVDCPSCGRTLYHLGGRVETKQEDVDEPEEVPRRPSVISAFGDVLYEIAYGMRETVRAVFTLIRAPFTAPAERLTLKRERERFEVEKQLFEQEKEQQLRLVSETVDTLKAKLDEFVAKVEEINAYADDFSRALRVDGYYKQLREEIQRRNEALIAITEAVTDTLGRVEEGVGAIFETMERLNILVDEVNNRMQAPADAIIERISSHMIGVVDEMPAEIADRLAPHIRGEIKKTLLSCSASQRIISPENPPRETDTAAACAAVPATMDYVCRALIFGQPSEEGEKLVLDFEDPEVAPTPKDDLYWTASAGRMWFNIGGTEIYDAFKMLEEKVPALKESMRAIASCRCYDCFDENGNHYEFRVTYWGNVRLNKRGLDNPEQRLTVMAYRAFLKLFKKYGITEQFDIGDYRDREPPRGGDRRKVSAAAQ